MSVNFYRCPVCGNIIIKVVDSGVTPSCCGRMMELMEPHTEEQGAEKHLPVVKCADGVCRVEVGSTPHPMEAAHHIRFVALDGGDSLQVRWLKPGEAPVATFALVGSDTAKAGPATAFEFCNIHGLWATETDA